MGDLRRVSREGGNSIVSFYPWIAKQTQTIIESGIGKKVESTNQDKWQHKPWASGFMHFLSSHWKRIWRDKSGNHLISVSTFFISFCWYTRDARPFPEALVWRNEGYGVLVFVDGNDATGPGMELVGERMLRNCRIWKMWGRSSRIYISKKDWNYQMDGKSMLINRWTDVLFCTFYQFFFSMIP